MIGLTHKKQKARGFNALILCGLLIVGLSGCAQIQSGRWYDSDAKPKQTTKSKQQAEGESRATSFWSNLRAKLDRRPEAKKARQAAASKREAARKTSASNTKTPKGLLVVEKGDTYYSLARKYDVPLRAFLELNSAKPPYILSPGDRVRLPTQAFYEVKKKDTLYSISRAHNTDVATLAKQNGLEKPYTISVGQRLQIPGLQSTTQERPRNAAVTQPQTNKIAKRKTEPSAPKRVGRFLVPVKGSIISSYGPKDGGLHNDGINIAAREGAPIRAAENGVVVYTGNELRGYGNLLLIRHSGGWVTAYAHTSKFLVKPGVRVKQGQIVAEVGRTGNVDRPQLHFELRKGTRAVNPQSLI